MDYLHKPNFIMLRLVNYLAILKVLKMKKLLFNQKVLTLFPNNLQIKKFSIIEKCMDILQ